MTMLQRERPGAAHSVSPSPDVGASHTQDRGWSPGLEAKVLQLRAGVHAELAARGYSLRGASPVDDPDDGGDRIAARAAQGLSGSGGALPFAERIQASFGQHDVSHVRAHQDGNARAACDAMGAYGYARGDQIALRSGSDLFTTAHEAAHVVQQRSGLSLSGGVGQAGDAHERHADAVAARVVAGQSASDLLDAYAGRGSGGGGGAAVQALQLRAYRGADDGASTAIVQQLIAGRDDAAMRAVQDAMLRASSQRRGAETDHVRARTAADTYDLTLAAPSTDALLRELEQRLATLSDESGAAVCEGEQPGRAGGNRPRQQVDRATRVSGLQSMEQWFGELIMGAVPTVGSSLGGHLKIDVSVDGIVLSIELQLEADHDQEDAIGFNAESDIGIGGGSADANATLRMPQGMSFEGVAANARAVGAALSAAVRNKFIHMGEGPLPDPVILSLATTLGGPMGGGVMAAGEFLLRGYNAARGRGWSNPCYAWLADRIWGEGFPQRACRAMGEGAEVESTRGVGVEGEVGQGNEDERVEASARAQYDNVRTESCGPGGRVRTEHEDRVRTSGHVQAGPFEGSLEITWTPEMEIKIEASAEVEHVPAAAGSFVAVMMDGVGAARQSCEARSVPPITVQRAAITTATHAAFRNAPEGTSLSINGELTLKHGEHKLKISIRQGMDQDFGGGAARGEVSLERGQSFEFDL